MSRLRRVSAFVDAILRDRRPPRFDASADEVEMLRAAAALRGARPEADLPRAEFVDSLERRLRSAADGERHPRHLVDRRRFLAGAGLAAAAAVTAVGAERAVGALRDQGTSAPAQDLVPEGATWQQVATVADVRSRGAVRFTSGAVQGYVLVSSDGSIDAVSAICTHMGCVINYNTAANRLDCPCHGASFHTDGSPIGRGYLSPLPRLQSRVNGDHVEVLA